MNHSQHPASAGDPPILAGKSGPVSYEVTGFSPGSWCARDPVYTLQEWSFCLPQSCGITHCWPSMPDSLGSPPPIARPPRLGSLIQASELSLLWENSCGTIIFQFVVHPPGMYEICFFITVVPLLPSPCGFFFVFECRVSFLIGSSIFWLVVIQQLVVILVFL